MEPTRPAISVLGGSATSYAPAFPSSCAAASAAAAAVRGSEIVYRCAATIDNTHHLRIFALNYSCSIGVLTIPELHTSLCQSLLFIAIPGIVNNETIFYSRLRRNFGPTSTTGSASPSLSGTHYGPENSCGAEGKKAVCQPSEAARGVFSRLPGVHRTHQCRQSRHRRVHRLSQWAERNRKIVIPPPQAPAERQTSGHL